MESGRDELDDFIRAFEEAYQDHGEADLAAFLPPGGHPLYCAVLRELVRVDLEFGWERGCPKTLDSYQRAFPELSGDRDALHDIAFEEYRLRRQAGQAPSADEYATRYGVSFESQSAWTNPDSCSSHASSTAALTCVAGWGDPPEVADLLPEVGDVFLGFRLVAQLGQGAFGRVYLARQNELASRPVVLKVTADRHDEAQTLAQLQHDHIVPIYSHHRRGPLHGVCMPYLGSVTLRDVLEDLAARATLPGSGRELLASVSKSSQRKQAGIPLPAEPVASDHDSALAAHREGNGGTTTGSGEPGGAPHLAANARLDAPHGPRDGSPGHRAQQAATKASEPVTRAVLGGLSYVEAVMWMVARLAKGLAHAHERGIFHRDLKPANVLVTDEGRPLLLDFNLAADLKAGHGDAGLGGTLPYMAPEHIEAFCGGHRTVDARSDIYALGVISYEMLTGRPPFPVRKGMRGDRGLLRAMAADRHAPPPRLRPFNPAISPAVESIVRHCLEPDPSRRYQSALALADDLERQLAHRPLIHAEDPSLSERTAKWLRRNARPLNGVMMVGLVSVLLAVLVVAHRQIDRFRSLETLSQFQQRVREAHWLMARALADPSQDEVAADAARQALTMFHVLEDGAVSWCDRAPAVSLPAARRTQLRRDAAELLLELAAKQAPLNARTPAADRQPRLLTALDYNERAEQCLAASEAPASLWTQRAELLGELGDREGQARAHRRAELAPASTAGDFQARGEKLGKQGRLTEALELFEQAIRVDPSSDRAWLSKGVCHMQLRENSLAEACFSTCIALASDNGLAWHYRGRIHLREHRMDAAKADLAKAMWLRPHDHEILLDQALVDLRTGDPAQTVVRLTRAIEAGAPDTRIYFIRAEARAAIGDKDGAKRDHEEGLRRVPTDTASWNARALARDRDKDTAGGLEDLERALENEPDAFDTLWNKQVLLSHQGAIAPAIAVLDRLATLYPTYASTRSIRGVFHARLGHRDEASADAEAALIMAPSPETHYYAACTYALTSTKRPADRRIALQHLRVAIRKGYGLQHVGTDNDLDPARDDAEFQRLVAQARIAVTTTPPATATTTPGSTLTSHPANPGGPKIAPLGPTAKANAP